MFKEKMYVILSEKDAKVATNLLINMFSMLQLDPSSRSRCKRGLRRGCAAARLLRLWVRIPTVARIFVCCACYVLAGRSLCDEMITRPEGSYRLWCVDMCDLVTS
jgi:hypothetical protein